MMLTPRHVLQVEEVIWEPVGELTGLTQYTLYLVLCFYGGGRRHEIQKEVPISHSSYHQ